MAVPLNQTDCWRSTRIVLTADYSRGSITGADFFAQCSSQSPNPFPEEEKVMQANIPVTKIKQIRQLFAEGKSKVEIAKVVGVHRATVYRYIEQPQQAGGGDQRTAVVLSIPLLPPVLPL